MGLRPPRAAKIFCEIQSSEVGESVYAVVRTGGKQHKVAVGDELNVELVPGETGDSVTLPALLLVDGATVTTDAAKLADVSVTAEILGLEKGPKIRIHKFKNKSGQHTRQGHRQKYTRLRVTGIGAEKAAAPKKAAKAASKVSTAKVTAPETPETADAAAASTEKD
jgi:large subunit ribosomal protein L21